MLNKQYNNLYCNIGNNMSLLKLVEEKDYIGFKKEVETIFEEKLLNMFKEEKEEIVQKAKVTDEDDENTEEE